MINHYLTKLKNQFNSDIIMNWKNIHKCILILVLVLGVHFLWIIWKIFIINVPSLWPLVNLTLVHNQIYNNTYSAIFIVSLIIFCYKIQNKKWADSLLPHFIITIFILMFIWDGFLVGIYSPATIFAFVCISGIGLILFNRKFVYFQLIIAISISIILIYLTYKNVIPYAPLFSDVLLNQDIHHNLFWVLSMTYFIVPILLACLILCEVLLSQWRHRESLIQVLSQTDPLTNLYNRRFFNEKIISIQKTQTQYAIILIDVDHFKMINDQYGHHIGDEALKLIASLLSIHVRSSDIIARYGGEEFIIAMPETSFKVANTVAERCRLAIQNLVLETLDHQQVHLTASFGIALSDNETQMSRIIHNADQALYQAKADGRNQVNFYKNNQ